jgi:hypothetical protein
MLRLIIGFIFVLSLGAQADVFKLASVTNSMDSDVYELYVESNDSGALQHLIGKNINSIVREKKESHILVKDQLNQKEQLDSYTLEQLRKGVVLVERSGRNIVDLRSIDVDAIAGGTAELSYLKSGISGKRKYARFTIREQDGRWVMFTDSGKLVHSIHFTTKKLLGKVIGLDKMIIK